MHVLFLLLPLVTQVPQAEPDQSSTPAWRPSAPTINELVASNATTFADEDGDSSDWIELHNAGAQPFSLEDWYLTDDESDLTKWRFPAVLLASGAHLVVFASDKDRAVAGSELHTNFKLKAGGEFLGLVRPDGTTLASAVAPSFPMLTTDQAYGAPLDAGALTFLNSATPGAVNSGAALPLVQLSSPSGIFDAPFALALSTDLPRSVPIHYTLDGSEPSTASPEYATPLPIDSTTRLRARAANGTDLGPETQAHFTRVVPALLGQTSTLPLVVVDTLGQPVETEDDAYTESIATFFDRTGTLATLGGPSDYHGRMGLRVRGSSSAGETFLKKSFRTELQDGAGDDLDADLFGLGAESDWVLYAPGRMDRNMIANPLSYTLSEELGLEAMGTQFCELYLNVDGGPVGPEDYEGIYVLTESIKISPNRIDLAELTPSDIVPPGVTGGYIFSVDREDEDELAFHTTEGFPHTQFFLNVVRPKLAELVPAQIEWVQQYFDVFEDALYGPSFTDPSVGYPTFLDIASWIDAHILHVLSMNPDALALSNFFHQDKGGKFVSGPIWDADRSMDSDDIRDDFGTTLAGRGDKFVWEWWERLFEDPALRGTYSARWFELRAGSLSEAALFARIDALQAEIAEAYPREEARWGSEPGYGSRFGDLQGEMDHLKDWLAGRLATLDAFNEHFPLENVAKGKAATQSSVELPNLPDRGCDGEHQSLQDTDSVVITLDEDEPWWEVDLGAVHFIQAIRLSNRWPGESDVASNFHVFVSDVPFDSTDLAATQAQPGVTDIHYPALGDRLLVFDVARTGRYVRLQLANEGLPRRLSFAELEVLE